MAESDSVYTPALPLATEVAADSTDFFWGGVLFWQSIHSSQDGYM